MHIREAGVGVEAKLPRFVSRNGLLLLVCLVALINVAFGYAATHSAYPFGGDSGMFPRQAGQIAFPFFIWFYNNYSGYVNNFNLSSPLLSAYYLIIYVLSGLEFGTLLYMTLSALAIRVLAGVGMFLLVYRLLNGKKAFSGGAAIAGLFASLLFTVHYAMFSAFGLGIYGVSLLPLALLPLLLFARKAYSGAFSSKYFLLSVLGIALEVGFLGYGQMIQGFLIVLLVSLSMAALAPNSSRKKTSVWVAGILVLSVAINASWIIMAHSASALASNELQMFSSSSQYDFANFYAPLVAGYDVQLLPNSGASALPNMIFNLSIMLAALASIFYIYGNAARHAKKRQNEEDMFAIGILVALLVLLAALASTHKPFGGVFSALYAYIPYLIVFRYAANSHYEVLFLVSVLSGFAFGKFLEVAHRRKHAAYYGAAIAAMVVLLAYYLYVGSFVQLGLQGIPYGTGTRYSTLLPFVHSIPQYALSISSYINSQKGDFAVATLPVDDDWHLATWYDAPDVYVGLINKPVYTGGFAYSEFFFPPSQDEYGAVGTAIQDGNTANVSIANGFGVFGIKYVIVQGDTSNHTLSPNNPLLPYSFSDIYSNLNSTQGMVFAGRYNTSSIYLDARAAPLAYATNLYVTNATTSAGIMDVILNKSFDIRGYWAYSKNFSAPILWYGSTTIFSASGNSISAISGFSQPSVTFVKDSPTKVTVHVSNATTPFYLVFRETYDPYWAAFYSNGTAVPSTDHIAVNGFANAWYVNRTGSYTMTLYYTPQTIAWAAWSVSFAALGATVAMSVYGWKESKRK